MSLSGTTIAAAGSAGTLGAPVTIGSTETIPKAYVGYILEIRNTSGGSINIGFVDPGKTPAGNGGTQGAFPVANNATRRWKLTGTFVDPADDLIHLTSSATTGVTWELYRG